MGDKGKRVISPKAVFSYSYEIDSCKQRLFHSPGMTPTAKGLAAPSLSMAEILIPVLLTVLSLPFP